MNETPSGERIHIGFFGRRNAGKSSLINAICGQALSVVSEIKGTTTDPVRKAMELLPLGPVLLIDTPGFDDEGSLGGLRVQKTKEILGESDMALLVVDAAEGLNKDDHQLLSLFKDRKIPYIVVMNKADLADMKASSNLSDHTCDDSIHTDSQADHADSQKDHKQTNLLEEEKTIYVSALSGMNIFQLKEKMARLPGLTKQERRLVGDFLKGGELVVLVIPIDKAAPKGRLILPQQQAIRDILDSGACPVCVRETELASLLSSLSPVPDLVITDSQVFEKVSKIVPDQIPLTSFSILMARYKGFLDTALKGAAAIDDLKDGDRVLISEGCSHHRQCDDIGTVKLPAMLAKKTGADLLIETSSGREFPEDLSRYRMVIHCGGCMLNEREMVRRMEEAVRQNIPFCNYGIAIAHMKGILSRSVRLFEKESMRKGNALSDQ